MSNGVSGCVPEALPPGAMSPPKSNVDNSHSEIAWLPLEEIYECHLFITHCEADSEFAFQLCVDLEKRGFKCGLAKKDFQGGMLIFDQIKTAIEKSRKILAVLSTETLKSYWCTLELSLTLERTKEDDKVPIVPVLRHGMQKSDLPDVLTQLEYVFEKQEDFWDALSKIIIGPGKSVDNLLPVGNVGHGLTWSYFYSFLNIIMPEMDSKIEALPHWSWSEERCMPRKLYLFLPESCQCPRKLTDADDSIKFDRLLFGEEYLIISRGGKERKYNSSVYKVESENKTYYFLAEFCSVIGSLKRIEDGEITRFSAGERKRQVVRFKYTLSDVLSHAFPDKAEVIIVRDEDKVGLSSLILPRIEKDIEKDIEQDRLAYKLRRTADPTPLTDANQTQNGTFESVTGARSNEDGPPCAQLASFNILPQKSCQGEDTATSFENASECPQYSTPLDLSPGQRISEEEADDQKSMTSLNPDDERGRFENGCKASRAMMSPNPNATAPPGGHWKYYAFIMYGDGDQDFNLACSLLDFLEGQRGLKCAMKDRDLKPGGCMLDDMAEMTIRSQRNILILSDETTENILTIFHMLRVPDRDKLHESNQPIPILRHPEKMKREIDDFCLNLTWLSVAQETFRERLYSAVKAKVAVPRLPAGNVAEGFAWSYFYSYLKLMLPSLRERVQNMENYAEIKNRISHKMFLFLPSSGLVLGTLADMLNVEHHGTVSLVRDTAGNVKRSFDSTVYRLDDPTDNQTYYFVGEYITPLVVLKDMETGQVAGLSSDARQKQVDRLYKRLEEIRNHEQARDLHATLRFFHYEDHEGYKDAIAEKILKVVKEEIAEECAV